MYTLWHRGPDTSWESTNTQHPSREYALAVANSFRLMGRRGYYAAAFGAKTPTSPDVDCTANQDSSAPLEAEASHLLHIARSVAHTDDWLFIYVLHNIFESLQGSEPN